MNLPALQYTLNCEDHDRQLDAVVEVRLGRGDEPPDDQGVHHVGAVGELDERDENLPIEQSVDGTWDEIHVVCSRCGSVDCCIAPRRTPR